MVRTPRGRCCWGSWGRRGRAPRIRFDPRPSRLAALVDFRSATSSAPEEKGSICALKAPDQKPSTPSLPRATIGRRSPLPSIGIFRAMLPSLLRLLRQRPLWRAVLWPRLGPSQLAQRACSGLAARRPQQLAATPLRRWRQSRMSAAEVAEGADWPGRPVSSARRTAELGVDECLQVSLAVDECLLHGARVRG